MLNVRKTQQGQSVILTLEGTIDEAADFPRQAGEISGAQLTVHCRGVKRLNSVGIKHWIAYFSAVARKGTVLRFVECSVPVVQQLNSIRNFAAGGQVESFVLPYACTACQSEIEVLARASEMRGPDPAVPAVRCPKCSAEAVLDDEPDQYLLFLTLGG